MRRAGSLALIIAFCASCAGPVYDRPWIEVETSNFRIISTSDEWETVALAKELELFRAVVQKITNAPSGDSAVPTRIIIFDGKYDFNLFRKGSGVVGYFKEGMRSNYIVLRQDIRVETDNVLRHEYVHFIMNNATELLYPPWYQEGFAEFLSTVTVHDDGEHIIIGAFPKDRKIAFRYAKRYDTSSPFKDIISLRRGMAIRGWMFYEQSWALVHWLQLGRGSDRSSEQDMNEYLALLEAGRTDVEAFEEAFGISMKNLRMEMREYLNGNYEAVAVPLAAFDHEDFIPRVKELSQEEISIALGDLAVAHENSRLAGELFHAALAAHPTSARAHTGLGNTFALRGAWKQAISKYQRALEIDPESAETELDYANCIQERALKQEDPAKRRELLKEARQHYVRSYKLNPGIPETYAMYGKTFLAPREYPARGIEALDRARGLLPANPTILRLLAKAYVLTERESDARALVERIVANEHGGDRVLKVDEVLEEIRNENVDAAGEGRERKRTRSERDGAANRKKKLRFRQCP